METNTAATTTTKDIRSASATDITNTHPNRDPNFHTLKSLARDIKTGKITNIVILAGAGISTSAGIPDFRTPQTGLYAKLAPLNLPYPEAIFTLSYFTHTPELFYGIAKFRHPDTLKPTISHAFLALLARRGILRFIFTQNIDGLETDAGVPEHKVLACHGNWKSQHCWRCTGSYPDELMKEAIDSGTVPYCQVEGCEGVVKPDVVFFGQSLPKEFDVLQEEVIPDADMMLVMGTSLKVAPCSVLPRKVGANVPRLLINMEKVGDFGNRAGDVLLLGGCDEGVRTFADELGWRDELETVWGEVVAAKEAFQKDMGISVGEKGEGGGEAELDECVEKMKRLMDEKLGISRGHKRMLERHIGDKVAMMLAKRGESS